MITGAFRTTNITAMEIESSIPPIDLWLDYKLDMEALHISRLANNHPISCRIAPEHRAEPIPQMTPPLPPHAPSRRQRIKPRTKASTCITRISNRILKDTERITPHAEPPWRTSELDIPEYVQIFTPLTEPGRSSKDSWRDDHNNFIAENEENPEFLFVYSDGSLTEKGGRRRTGYGVVAYNKGLKVFKRSGALGEHTEVFDTEMMGLHVAAEATREFLLAEPPHLKPPNIIFYADNAGSITRIFDGAPGKVQAHSRAFRKTIRKIIKEQDNVRIAISWCPGHSGIIGNDAADDLTKSGVQLTPTEPGHKTQAYVAGLRKRELLEAWR